MDSKQKLTKSFKNKIACVTLFTALVSSQFIYLPNSYAVKNLDDDNYATNEEIQKAKFDAKPINENIDQKISKVQNMFYAQGEASKLTEENPMLKTTNLPGWEIIPDKNGNKEVVVFYDILKAKTAAKASDGLVTGNAPLGGFYEQASNGRCLPWLTAYHKSKEARPGYMQITHHPEVRLLYIGAGQGISQTFDVVAGQHFAAESIAIRPDSNGPSNVRIKFYNAQTGDEITNYGVGSNNSNRHYPASWGTVGSRLEKVPEGISQIKVVVSAEGAPLILGPIDVRGGANLKIYKDILESEKTANPVLKHENDKSYNSGKAIREGDISTIALEVKNVGQGITQGSITINDKIPEGFEFVEGSVKVYDGLGNDISEYASLKKYFFEIDKENGTITIRPATNDARSGLYSMREHGEFFGMGFEGYNSEKGKTAKSSHALKVTYKIKSTFNKDTIGKDENGKPTDIKSIFTQASVSFSNLWEGKSVRTNYAPVIKTAIGTNTPPVIDNKAKTVTIDPRSKDSKDLLEKVTAQNNVTTTDYEDDIRKYATEKTIVSIKDSDDKNIADLESILDNAGKYTITYQGKDADGNLSNTVTTTVTVIDVPPLAPLVGSVNTAGKEVPITIPSDKDLSSIEITFPDKKEKVVVTKEKDGDWKLDGKTIKIENNILLVPLPSDVKLVEGNDKITAIAKDKAGNSSPEGKGNVTNNPPQITVTNKADVEKLSTVDLLKDIVVSDNEDDSYIDDNKVTSRKYEVTLPDGVVKTITEKELRAFTPLNTGIYKIKVVAIDSDGKVAEDTFTVRVKETLPTVIPIAPVIDEIDTVSKVIPISVSTDNPKKLEVAVTGKDEKGNPKVEKIILIANEENGKYKWKDSKGREIKVENNKILVPVPPLFVLEKGKDKILAVVTDTKDTSSPQGKGKVNNTSPKIHVENKGNLTKGESVNLLDKLVVSDKEDDTDTSDKKNTSITYRLTSPDGSVKVVTETELLSFTPDVIGTYSVEITAIDSDGDDAVASFTFNVQEKQLPLNPKDNIVVSPKDKHNEKTSKVTLKAMANTGLNSNLVGYVGVTMIIGFALLLVGVKNKNNRY